MPVRSAYSVVCGFTNRNRPLPFKENSGPSITKSHPKEWLFYRGTIGSLKVAVYFTGSQARVDLAFLLGRQKMGGRPSLFAVHENQLSAPVFSWTSPKLQCGRFRRNDCVASRTDYNWCTLWAMVTKENDKNIVAKCLTKWKTKMITRTKLWSVIRLLFIWVVRSIVMKQEYGVGIIHMRSQNMCGTHRN